MPMIVGVPYPDPSQAGTSSFDGEEEVFSSTTLIEGAGENTQRASKDVVEVVCVDLNNLAGLLPPFVANLLAGLRQTDVQGPSGVAVPGPGSITARQASELQNLSLRIKQLIQQVATEITGSRDAGQLSSTRLQDIREWVSNQANEDYTFPDSEL